MWYENSTSRPLFDIKRVEELQLCGLFMRINYQTHEPAISLLRVVGLRDEYELATDLPCPKSVAAFYAAF